ncbi:MAG: PAS domain-containing sensor histidine kinase [Promethearchaeota archaeon]
MKKKNTQIKSLISIIQQNNHNQEGKIISQILSSINDAICITDIDNNILKINQIFANLYSEKILIIGKKCHEVLYNKKARCSNCNCLDSSINGKKEYNIISHRTLTGKIIRILEETFHPIIDEETGEVIARLINIHDITKRLRIQEKIDETHYMYEIIFENFIDAIYLYDLYGNILEVNNTICEWLGYTKEELINLNIFNIISTKNKDEIIKRTKGLSFESQKLYQLEFLTKDGVIIPIEQSSKLIQYRKKPVVMSIARNITERKKSESFLKDFIYRASHELKTPLNSVIGATEVLKQYYQNILDDKAENLVNLIIQGGERLKSLINDIIDISKFESGKSILRKSKTNICELIKKNIKNLSFFIEERNLLVNFNEPNKVIFINVDPVRLGQVITNIIGNAIKYTPPLGSIDVYIKKSDFLEIYIKDTGIGFNKDEFKVLFQKFGKIERFGQGLNVNTEGSGLGLYLSKEIIKLHNGEILVESEGRFKGSTFIIKLPLT